MKNKAIVIIASLAFLCGLAAPAEAQSRFGIKLGGGLGYVGGGDINSGFQGISDYFTALYTSVPGILARDGYEPFHLGMDLGGEFFVHITPELAIGLGGGFMTFSKESSMTLTDGSDSATLNWTAKVKAVPLTLNFHYFIPAGSRLKIVLTAGAGYYLAGLEASQGYFGASQDWDFSGGGIGFHGGVGLELALAPNVSLVFDAMGRYASIGGLEGDATQGGMTVSNGKIWAFEILTMGLGNFPFIMFDLDAPTGSDIRNVHEAKLGLSGFSAGISLLFRI